MNQSRGQTYEIRLESGFTVFPRGTNSIPIGTRRHKFSIGINADALAHPHPHRPGVEHFEALCKMSDVVLDREFQPLFRTDTIHLQSIEGNG